MSVSVRVFDAMYGRPAIGMAVRLDRDLDGTWVKEKRDQTDEAGRITGWAAAPLTRGAYQLEFDLDAYFSSLGAVPFYPVVSLRFRVLDPDQLHDISLLITPYAYFTYQQNGTRTLPFIGAMAGMFDTPQGDPVNSFHPPVSVRGSQVGRPDEKDPERRETEPSSATPGSSPYPGSPGTG